MTDGRLLQIFRDGNRYQGTELLRLPAGAQGNVTTLSIMARIVREDSAWGDLRNMALRDIVGLHHTNISDQIDAAFTWCRDEIVYRDEGNDTETVADLWHCRYGFDLANAVGDCAIKSVALATILSYLKLRPVFIAISQVPGADYFNHVYVGIEREDGSRMALDPTPGDYSPGQEADGDSVYTRLIYKIFR